jgi:predicted histidine transporter YuiF (NhaC family)
MDVLVLLGSFTLLCALGVPVAYALGLGAIIAALYVDIPLEAVMLKISDGTDDFALLAIPFFVLAVAMPPSAMMAPASTKKGIASSAKSSVPSEIFSITASSGMST